MIVERRLFERTRHQEASDRNGRTLLIRLVIILFLARLSLKLDVTFMHVIPKSKARARVRPLVIYNELTNKEMCINEEQFTQSCCDK